MRLSSRSFPHPVVGNADDVPGAAFQATFDFASDKTNYYLEATIQCSSRTLLRMIAKGSACYTLHVECGNTLFRRSYDFDTPTHKVTIPASAINDAVEVNAFVRAKKIVWDYAPEGAHEDYGDNTFAVGPGDILAVGDGQVFDADNSADPLRRVGALMVVEQSAKPGDHPMEVDFDFRKEKVRILLCEADFVAYRELKGVPHLTNHLTTTLVLPVLVQAIPLVESGGEDVDGCKWAKLLKRRLDDLNAGPASDALSKAQQLLELPIRRALASAKVLAGTGG